MVVVSGRNDRTKVVDAKIKDRKLCIEIIHKLCLQRFYRINESAWKLFYNDLIVPNKHVVSTMIDLKGRCILHYACNIHYKFMMQLIETFPNLIALTDNLGVTSLMKALAYGNNATYSVAVLKMLELCPQAVEVPDNDGMFPLHDAVRLSGTIVLKMIELFPQAIMVPNRDGSNALQLAIIYDQSETVVLKMIELFPQAIMVPNCDGSNALQLAIRYDQSETVVLKMIQLCPNAIEFPNNNGEYALHCATKYRRSDTIIMKLIEVFPNALEIPDARGNYTLHNAVRCRQLECVTLKMIELFPYPITVPNNGRFYVLHLAIMCEQSEMIVMKLLELFPPTAIVEVKGTVVGFALEAAVRHTYSETVLVKILDLYQQVPEKMYYKTKKRILNRAQKYYARFKEKYKRTPSELVLVKLNQLLISKKRKRNK